MTHISFYPSSLQSGLKKGPAITSPSNFHGQPYFTALFGIFPYFPTPFSNLQCFPQEHFQHFPVFPTAFQHFSALSSPFQHFQYFSELFRLLTVPPRIYWSFLILFPYITQRTLRELGLGPLSLVTIKLLPPYYLFLGLAALPTLLSVLHLHQPFPDSLAVNSSYDGSKSCPFPSFFLFSVCYYRQTWPHYNQTGKPLGWLEAPFCWPFIIDIYGINLLIIAPIGKWFDFCWFCTQSQFPTTQIKINVFNNFKWIGKFYETNYIDL